MNPPPGPAAIAFEGDRRIAAGDLREVARAAKATLDRHSDTTVLVFDSGTSAPIDLDFRGSINDVLARLPEVRPPAGPTRRRRPPRGRGRPKLGVVAREVTLLPRHWEWLAQQRGGASVAIRRLVEQARRGGDDRDRPRQAQEAAYRFMAAMAGNLPHYEEAIRALFAPTGPFRKIDRRMAGRRARPRLDARRRRVSRRAPDVSRLIPQT